MPTDEAPQRMVEWSRTAATLLRALARAYPRGAPPEIKTPADRIWELAARGATLQGALEAHSNALERFVETNRSLRAELAKKTEAANAGQLAAYDAAYEQDLQAGRAIIAARVEEAHACEKGFDEARAALVEHLRHKPACREVLEELPSR